MSIDDAAAQNPPVRRLYYKYMSREVAKIVLENRTLRWSTPATLNDPHDIQLELRGDVDVNELRRRVIEKMWADYNNPPQVAGNAAGWGLKLLAAAMPGMSREQFEGSFRDFVSDHLARWPERVAQLHEELRPGMAMIKVLCLSEVADNELMWAHYAEAHRGVVVGFADAEGVDSPWSTGRPINYVADVPRFMDDEELSEFMSGRQRIDVHEVMRKLVFTKGERWSYEREWRIWTGVGRDANAAFEDVQFNTRELSVVVFGQRCPPEDRNQLAELTGRLYPHATLLHAVKNPSSFELQLEAL